MALNLFWRYLAGVIIMLENFMALVMAEASSRSRAESGSMAGVVPLGDKRPMGSDILGEVASYTLNAG